MLAEIRRRIDFERKKRADAIDHAAVMPRRMRPAIEFWAREAVRSK